MIAILRRTFDQKNLVGLCSIILLGFGRSSAVWWLSPLTAVAGLFCALIACQRTKLWYSWTLFWIILLTQSSWLLSHPFAYIWGVWLVLSLLFSLPYALLARFTVQCEKKNFLTAAGWAAAFSLLEWSFAQLPCGYSFQSAALQLSWNLWSLQVVSLVGAIGLGFFVFLTNILLFFWVTEKKPYLGFTALAIALFPYLLGGSLFYSRNQAQLVFNKTAPPPSVAFFHMEEPPDVESRGLQPTQLHEQEWSKIFPLIARIPPNEISLLVLPEGAIPFAAESPLFRSSRLPQALQPSSPLCSQLSSIDIAHLIASRIHAPVLIGLEGRQIEWDGRVAAYNSCFFVTQDTVRRYDKQLLLPLGEYIPFPALASFLSSYGIHNSFSPGKESSVFQSGSLRISPLICYEETFSSYALAAALLHPTVLVSLSNDCWYPTIRKEHFELARLRAVEIGVPLVRSCNQGVSAAVDALGRVVARKGEREGEGNSCVITPLSQYCAPSLYASVGQAPIVLILAALWASAVLLPRFAPRPKQAKEVVLR
jgi:apolipoprotein N-acyltransferase